MSGLNLITYSYGTDTSSMKIDDVICSSNYLSIFQCSFSTIIDSGCTNSNSYDATVYCCKYFRLAITKFATHSNDESAFLMLL